MSGRRDLTALLWALALQGVALAGAGEGVRIKDLARIDGVRDNMIVGYGIVTGLAGTGDSSRSEATMQSIVSALQSFGVNVTPSQLSSRNVAGVMVTATLPALSRVGDKVDVNVSSVGDARRLTGGTECIEAHGSTVGDLIDDIERRHPGFRAAVVERGDLVASLAVSVDAALASGGLLEPVRPDSEVHLVPALGGG